MKLTKSYLRKIIKEEISNVLKETRVSWGGLARRGEERTKQYEREKPRLDDRADEIIQSFGTDDLDELKLKFSEWEIQMVRENPGKDYPIIPVVQKKLEDKGVIIWARDSAPNI
jgi:hypothetical protein